ncbi:MAG: YqiA/YcfP family alpha/beta fold hydrolase [Pseudomonadota bacterium]
MSIDHVVFSHGLESGPWGTKIQAMAEVARAAGAAVDSIDYEGMREPQPRVDKLVAALAELEGRIVLVGSSMGGYVATAAAQQMTPAGVFVLAPAFHMEGFDAVTPPAPDCPMEIVHGWHDDVVPVDNSIRFAREHVVALHLVDSDHRLGSALPVINELLGAFLARL